MTAVKVLVTPRSLTKAGHPCLEEFRKAGYEVLLARPDSFPSEDELVALLPDCVGYLAGVEPVSARVLDCAKHLRVIGRNGTGVDNIDIAAARRKGIQVCRADGANARAVAELAFAHILASVREIPFCDRNVKKGEWVRRKGMQLEGRTLSLVGCGNIGRLVARFALAFDMTVIAHDPAPADPLPSSRFSYGTLAEVMACADIISLHCPPSDNGEPLINRGTIAAMKRGVYLVNTARAALIDDDAVLEALGTGHIAGLGMDVFRSEPPKDLRLVQHCRVIATPHVGGLTDESVDRAASLAVTRMLEVLSRLK